MKSSWQNQGVFLILIWRKKLVQTIVNSEGAKTDIFSNFLLIAFLYAVFLNDFIVYWISGCRDIINAYNMESMSSICKEFPWRELHYRKSSYSFCLYMPTNQTVLRGTLAREKMWPLPNMKLFLFNQLIIHFQFPML